MRRFYSFNSENDVRGHIAQVKTLADVLQLKNDIAASGTNLTRFKEGFPGVYAVDCCAGEQSFRHVFMTRAAHLQYGELTK